MPDMKQNPDSMPQEDCNYPKSANGAAPEQAADKNAIQPIEIQAKDEVELLEKQKKVLDDLMGKFDEWSAWRRPYERIWDEIYRVYFSQTDKAKTPSRSMVTVPIVFQIIEAAVPKVVNTLFASGEEFFEVLPTDPREETEAKYIEILLNYQLAQADFFLKFMDFAKQLVLYGTSYFLTSWKVTRKWVWDRKPIRQDLNILGFKIPRTIRWEETKEYRVVERRPEVEVVDILDVFPNPDATSEKDCKGIFIRSWMDINEIKEMGEGRFAVFANTKSDDLKPDKAQYTASRQMRYSVRGVSTPSSVSSKQVEVLSFWGEWDLDGDGIREQCYIVIANRRVLLKAIANPFHHQKIPLIRTVCFPIPKEWYGLGLVEPIIPNVHELWTLRRQRLDNINMVLNRMWKVNALADVDLDTLISSPNGIIITDQMDGVEPLMTPDVTANAYNEAAVIQADIENAVVPRSVQGSPESGNLGRTARGAAMIITQAMEKFSTIIKLSEEMGIKRVLRMFHQLNLQFLDEDEFFTKTGFYGGLFERAILPEDIRAEVRFRMAAMSDMVNKEGKINQIVSFMGVFGKILSPDSISTLAKKVWTLMGFNPDDVSLQGAQPPAGVENIVDGNISSAILGQAQNQGLQGQPTVPPQGAK